MDNDVMDGLQADGKTFLSFKRDDVNNDRDDDINDDGESKKIDLSFLPEEHRSKVEGLFSLLGESFSAQLEGLKTKADMVDVLMEQLKAAGVRTSGDASGDDGSQKKGLFDDVKFEENDYYAKFFKKTFEVLEQLNNRIDGLGGTIENQTKQSTEEKLRQFFTVNKVPKAVVLKMDEIAQSLGSGGKAYSNLDRLLKLAKYELGIADKPAVNRENDNSSRGEKRRASVFEFSGSRKGGTEKKQIRNMMDAWNAAEEQLQEER